MSVAAAIRRARTRFPVPSAVWPLADQGLVSVGGFLVNLTLARSLPPQDYGVFCLLFMAMLQIQVVSGSLIFYPLVVRGTVLADGEQAALFGNGLALSLGFCIPLGLLLTGGLLACGEASLIGPSLLWLAAWQFQELLRRTLLAQMRYASAIPGDAVRYGGQAAGLIALAASGRLTLEHAVLAMAVAAGFAAAWQALQVRISFLQLGTLQETARGFCRAGLGSLGSNLLSTLSVMIYPWCLAAFGGAASAAGFQAALNVVMVVNPVLIGLCNIIPQSVAREIRHGSMRQAWRASSGHMALGAAPVFAFYGIVLLWPQPILTALYGAASPYVALATPARMMAAALMLGFATEMVNAFLHGIQRTRLSMRINAAGLAAAVLVGLPLTAAWGLAGACIGLLAANVARAALAGRVLSSLLADAPDRSR